MSSIQTNVNSLVAQENLRVNTNFQSKTIQRLTSGYRINQAGDDAAGLAVANKFRSDRLPSCRRACATPMTASASCRSSMAA